MILIGSRALQSHLPEVFARKPKDFDYICTIERYEELVKYCKDRGNLKSAYPLSGNKMVMTLHNGNILEFEIAWEGSSGADILAMFSNKRASLALLLMLKLSHRYLKNSPHFLKTMDDIHLLRQYTTLTPELEVILKKREKETYQYKHPSLNQSKEGFFADTVKYKYGHDSIHLAVAIDEKPAYEYFKPENSEVMVDMNMFETLPERIKLNAALEEGTVLACERSVFYFVDNPPDRDWAFKTALMKICTSITSGKFREFCWENYHRILELYYQVGRNYVERVIEAIGKGIVIKL